PPPPCSRIRWKNSARRRAASSTLLDELRCDELPLEEELLDEGRALLPEVDTVTLGMIDVSEFCTIEALVLTSCRTMTDRLADWAATSMDSTSSWISAKVVSLAETIRWLVSLSTPSVTSGSRT